MLAIMKHLYTVAVDVRKHRVIHEMYSVHMLLFQDWEYSWSFLLGCNRVASERQLSWCICYRYGKIACFYFLFTLYEW